MNARKVSIQRHDDLPAPLPTWVETFIWLVMVAAILALIEVATLFLPGGPLA